MNGWVRLFVAIELGATVAAETERVRQSVADYDAGLAARGLRWVPVGQTHLTLRFIGNVPAPEVDALVAALGTGVPVMPFRITLTAPTWLPSPSRPRVLKFDVGEGRTALERLQAIVEARLLAAGLAPESRAFLPHVTVARVRDDAARRVRAAAATLQGLLATRRPVASDVHDLVLVESELTRQGALHRVRARVRFEGDAPVS